MPEEFKFKLGDRVQTNQLFKDHFKYESPFSGIVTSMNYATSLGEQTPYIAVGGSKDIPQKYLEISPYESPYEDPEYINGLKILEDQKTMALYRQKLAEDELKKAKKEVDEIFEKIVKFKESFGVRQNVR